MPPTNAQRPKQPETEANRSGGGANGANRDAATEAPLDRSIVRSAAEMLIRGDTPDEIVESLRLAERQIDRKRLFEAVGRRFDRAAAVPLERTVGWALEAYRDCYRSAREAGDLKAAIAALAKLVELKRGTIVLDD